MLYLVSELLYSMHNVPTRQKTIQSYSLEDNELIPRDNTIYNSLRVAIELVYRSPSTG